MRQKIIISLFILALFHCKTEPKPIVYQNLCKAIEQSKKESKPLFIHYTAFGLGYNEFLNDFVTNKEILRELEANFILLELFIDDDRIETNIQRIQDFKCIEIQIDSIKSRGELNSWIQKEFTNTVNQPFYQIVNSRMENLIEPFEYINRDELLFKKKLLESKANYTNGNTN